MDVVVRLLVFTALAGLAFVPLEWLTTASAAARGAIG